MVRCSRCGKEMGDAPSCPGCGGTPSQSVINKGAKKVTAATGEVIETGVHATETVAREAKPLFKKALNLGKKGVSKAKSETLQVAKKLKDEDG
ncbi:MAG: hypothetical protein JSV94_04975 [Methanobacteriota archaeon]|nr:MAG: hypothetical protein JSV94_04975 [Euryarchaeota archaeon]